MNIAISPELLRQAAEETADPVAVVELALGKLGTDAGAMYESDVIDALKVIRRKDEAAYTRLVARATGCKTRLDRLAALERDSHQDSNQDLILQVAQTACQYHHDGDGQGVAVIETDGHREVHLVDGQGFKKWLRAAVYKPHRMGIPDQAMNTALATLNAIGNHEGDQIAVHQRCAKVGNAYFIDCCDDAWRVIRVDEHGVQVLDRSPVYFIRSKGMRPFPALLAEGDVDKLWKHINIPAYRQPLVLAWLLDSLRPDTPFPVLELTGEMGSAKSSAQRRLRDLVDPNEVPLRARPKTVEDIHVAASGSYLVSYENLSNLTPDQQDAFCIISTGGGFATRALYTNGDEFVLRCKNPVIFNGINPVTSQSDLIDRAISVELPSIPSAQRQNEQALDASWQEDYPAIFTGLLHLLSRALRQLQKVTLDDGKKKRMIDYQTLGEAICLAQGLAAGHFSDVLDEAQGEGVLRGLETFGISNAISVLMDGRPKPWEGTCLKLLAALSELPGIDRSHWPKSARGLAAQLKRIAPGLRRTGIGVEMLERDRQGRSVRLSNFRRG